MSDKPTPNKYGQLIVGDSSLEKALSATSPLAVELPLFVPTTRPNKCTKPCASADGAAKASGTIGGFMAVPLVGAKFGDKGKNKQEVRSYCESVCASQILLIIDTGSEAYFVHDDTGCGGANPVPQFLKFCGIEDMKTVAPRGGMSLTVGTMDQDDDTNFVIEHPLEWFVQSPASISIGAQVASAPTERSQTIIVGNFFLQSLAVTWNAARQVIAFSNLDQEGHRCSVHMYGKPSANEEEKTLARFSAESYDGKEGSPGVRWNKNISLSGEELTFAGGIDQEPILDTTIDLRFMKKWPSTKRSRYGESILTMETTDPRDVSEICLDATVTLQDGTKTQICQPLDTGSGVNLISEPSILQTQSVTSDCIGGGTVGNVFRSIVGSSADVRSCAGPNEAQCGVGCCNTCCLPSGTTATTAMKCSVTFCTGMMSYDPTFTKLTFPLENGTTNLDQVKTYVGSATNRCLAVPMTGVWGFWFWTQTLKDGDKTTQVSTGLPYYLLSHLGVSDPKYSNFTLKIWRTDLAKAKDAVVRVGSKSLAPLQRYSMTSKTPAWYADLQSVNAPSAAPVDAPYAAPIDAPFAAPVDAPYAAPIDAPFAAPVAAPFATPVAPAPFASPIGPPLSAPIAAPHSPPLVEAPFSQPVAAPKSSRRYAPIGAPVFAPSPVSSADSSLMPSNGNNINLHISNTNSNSNNNTLPSVDASKAGSPLHTLVPHDRTSQVLPSEEERIQRVQIIPDGTAVGADGSHLHAPKNLWPWAIVGLVMFAFLILMILLVAVRQNYSPRYDVSSSIKPTPSPPLPSPPPPPSPPS